MVKTDKEKIEYHRRWREKNKDKIKESQKKYQDSKGGKTKCKKWRNDNPDKILESNRKYVKNNHEKVNTNWRKYYNTIKGRLKTLKRHDTKRLDIKKHKLTIEILEMINERDKVCVYCGKDFNKDIEHDHINPFRQFDETNIVKCCRKCNRKKSSSDMIQWMNFKKYKISQKLLDLYKKAYK